MHLGVATVIPAYNPHSRYLAEALDCLQAQTIQPDEIVIVDDGSDEPVRAPYRVIRQANGGVSTARNRGVIETSAPLIHVFDCDELLDPSFYDRILSRMADADVAFARMALCEEDGSPRTGDLPDSDFDEPRDWVAALLAQDFIGSSAAVFRRDAWEQVGGWKPYPRVQDWRFWIDIALAGGTFRFVPDRLAVHRIHSAQLTDDLGALYKEGIDMLGDLTLLRVKHRFLCRRTRAAHRMLISDDWRAALMAMPYAPREAVKSLRSHLTDPMV